MANLEETPEQLEQVLRAADARMNEWYKLADAADRGETDVTGLDSEERIIIDAFRIHRMNVEGLDEPEDVLLAS